MDFHHLDSVHAKCKGVSNCVSSKWLGAQKAKNRRSISDLMSGTFRRPLLDDLRDLSGLYS